LLLCLCRIIWCHALGYPQHCSFLLRIPLAILVLLCFYMNLGFFFYFCEEFHWAFNRDGLESVDHFW
jgi:hypothetical protein